MLRIALWLFVLIIAVASSAVQADTLISMKEGSRQTDQNATNQEVPGGADQGGEEVQIWSRPGNMARVDASGRMIFALDRGVTYTINDANKTCRAFQHPESYGASSGANDTVEVRKTGQSKKFGPWQADGYEFSVDMEGLDNPMEVSFWVSDELTIGLDTYRDNFAAMAIPQTAWMSKILELGGYPVYQESRIGHLLVWSELLSVSDESAPEGIYDVPAGYTGCSEPANQ